jgi:hypothetical protein
MTLVYFAFQPAGRRAGAGALHTPIYSRSRHLVKGDGDIRIDTRKGIRHADRATIELLFSKKFYQWIQEIETKTPGIPKPLNGIFFTSKTLPKGEYVDQSKSSL